MTNLDTSHSTSPAARQRGLSLVELMISMAIGLLLLAGITSLIVSQSASRDELEKSSRQIENGRYAMQLLKDDIELAGYYGDFSPASGVAVTVPTNPCGITLSDWNANTPTVPVGIFGYAPAAANPTPCTQVTNYQPNTAVLVIERASTLAVSAVPAPTNGATYLQVSRCPLDTPQTFVIGTSGYTMQKTDCAAGVAGTPADLRQFYVNLYYISSCDICSPTPDNIPTLKLVQNGAAPIPLVEGIENMQFDYGIDTDTDGYPNIYTTTPTSWPDVVAVRVNLLARNNDSTMNYQDTKTYCLSGNTANCVAPGALPGVMPSPATALVGPINDQYKRHLYSNLIRAINPSQRRAMQ